MKLATALLTAVLCLPTSSPADDWPHWMGPHGDMSWREPGLIQKLPEGGPKVLWRAPVRNGYAGPAVAAGKVFVPDYVIATGKVDANPGGRTALTGQERLLCLDAATGKSLWTYAYDCPINLSFPNGPRATPCVEGDRVYHLGAEGHLACLLVKDGSVVWKKELKSEYGVESPIWGFTQHPLVHGDFVFCQPGGKGHTIVALNKLTGAEAWRALDSKNSGYAPPTIIHHGGQDQLLVWHGEAVNSLDPATGKVHWSVPFDPSYGMAIMTPQLSGDLIFLGAIVKKSILLKLSPDLGKPVVVWNGTPKMALGPKNGTPLVDGDFVYGCDSDGELRFARLSTGERLWESLAPLHGKTPNSGTFFLVKAGAQHVLFTDEGDLILAKISETGYEETSRAHVIEPGTPGMGRSVVWAHPAFARRCVFVRNDRELICLSLAAD